MEIAKILVILSVTCVMYTQGLPVKASSEENYPQNAGIARILQAPLYRPVAPPQDEFSSYFPVNYDAIGSQSSSVEESVEQTGAPSTRLQPPSASAPELFSANQDHELSKELPTHQLLPLLNKPINFFDPKFLAPNARLTSQVPSTLLDNSYYPINPLSKQLDLPLPNTPTQAFAPPPVPAKELELPVYQPFLPFRPIEQNPSVDKEQKSYDNFNPALSPNLELPYLTPPQPFNLAKDELVKPKKEFTKSFPKKYNPANDGLQYKKTTKKIPVFEVAEDFDANTQINLKRPQKLVFKPQKEEVNLEAYLKERELEEKRLKFEEVQKKNALKKETEERQQKMIDATRARAAMSVNDPEASETEFNTFGVGSSFAAAPHHAASHNSGPSLGLSDASHHAGGDRTEFQMYGQHGPHSYKFGYDTGKGKNRQFRYEERDNDGYVKGHYGFYDKQGKLQVINYDAHPHHGFHAEGAFGKV